jgi:S1-C subfamily serine protease
VKKIFKAVFIVWLMVVALPFQVNAQDMGALTRSFDARYLTQEEKRFLQTALAFEGRYNGMLDGDWGRISQNAMEQFAWQEFDGPPQDWHMALLAMAYFDRLDSSGWKVDYLPGQGVSLLLPLASLTVDGPANGLRNWRHLNSSLGISFGRHDARKAGELHDYTLSRHGRGDPPYTVRADNLAITSVETRDGVLLYTRSDYVSGSWSTVMLSSALRDRAILGAVSSSIAVGVSRPITITEGGRVAQSVEAALRVLSEQEGTNGVATGPSLGSDAEPDVRRETAASGSGFFVSRAGHVLTNAHVVEGCRSYTVDGEQASLVDSSEDFDLAILQSSESHDGRVAVFAARPARLNSDVTALGFPYADLLGGLNVTRGSVSSLKGLQGNRTTIQITAPVQPGSSGGPLLNKSGYVVGVVVSKLDSAHFLKERGDLPQNVNFAVRGEIAKLYLAQNGIDPEIGLSDEALDGVDIAELGSSFTTYIECQ